jgi:hypothetical protein
MNTTTSTTTFQSFPPHFSKGGYQAFHIAQQGGITFWPAVLAVGITVLALATIVILRRSPRA